jgi:hypothetical protein
MKLIQFGLMVEGLELDRFADVSIRLKWGLGQLGRGRKRVMIVSVRIDASANSRSDQSEANIDWNDDPPKALTYSHNAFDLSLTILFVEIAGEGQGISEDAGDVAGPDFGEMLNLMAATGAGSNNDGAVGLLIDLGHQRFGDGEGEFVFGLEHAERAGHSTAAGLQWGDGAVGQTGQQTGGVTGIAQRLCVTMDVQGKPDGFVIEFQRLRFGLEQAVDEFFEQKTAGILSSR